MLIYIKSYITYSCFILIEKTSVIRDIWSKPYDYQRVKRQIPL